jgi:hypothetical protein
MVRYGFLDEAGDVGYSPGASGKFIVAVVVVGHPERLRKAVTKTRKALVWHLRDLPEMKATHNKPRINEKLLTRAVEIGFDAVAVVIDKTQFPRPQESEDLYRYACARAIREALERFGPLTVTLDKRDTTKDRRQKLDKVIYAVVEDLDMPMELHHVESHEERVLQVADAVAWALFQKHVRGNETFWQIIRENITEVRL